MAVERDTRDTDNAGLDIPQGVVRPGHPLFREIDEPCTDEELKRRAAEPGM